MSRYAKISIVILILFVAVSLILTVNVSQAYALSPEDLTDNSSSNPYVITTAQDILDLAVLVNTGSNMLGKYFLLGADIDLSAVSYSPIGTASNMFQGNFDGNNHTINLNINSALTYRGLFGYLGNNASVSKIIISGSIIGNNYTGAIAGFSAGTINSCINNANITASAENTAYVGGIAGESIGTIDSCVNNGIVNANTNIGGIAGRNMSVNSGIFSCANLGEVNAVEGSVLAARMGGITGESRGIIANSYNYAFINATGSRIGSLVGNLIAAPTGTQNCYNINAKSVRNLIGQNETTLPSTFSQKNIYDFLEKNVVFSANTMVYPDFIQGYGFLTYPKQLSVIGSFQNQIKCSLFNSGIGTTESPFVINDLRQWGLFLTNTKLFDYSGANILLNRSLTLPANLSVSSIDKPFAGVFDGGNYTLEISMSGNSNVGLFEAISGGTIKNLVVSGQVSATGDFVAGIAARALSGQFINVTNNCIVSGKNYVGGILGGSLSGNVTFVSAINNGSVTAENSAGGIAGYAEQASAENVNNYATINVKSAESNINFGGLFGKINASGILTNGFNNGAINATKSNYVGGLIGYGADCDITMSANLASVVGRNNVGGILGYAQDSVEKSISSSMAVANITGAVNVCGILGTSGGLQKQINNVYFAGALLQATDASVNLTTFKPIANSSQITDSFYNSDLTNYSGGGEGKNYVELTDNVFGVTAIDLVWQVSDMQADFGYYPALKISALTPQIIEQKLKIYYFGGGDGSSQLPYLIANEQTLRNFAYLSKNHLEFDYDIKNYRQTANIGLSRAFSGVCSYANPFNGGYDGDYYLITNLNITGEDYCGFFAALGENAVVAKLCLDSGTISGNDYTGAIAGTALRGAELSDSYANLVISGLNNVGGLLGTNYGSVLRCFFAGRISANSNVGGIVGTNEELSAIAQCFSLGYISGQGNVGGIAGVNRGDITICQVSGTVNLTLDNTYGGGIAGEFLIGNITNTYTLSVLTSSGEGSMLGGLVGQFTNIGDAVITNTYFNLGISKVNYPYYIGTTPSSNLTGRVRDTSAMLNNAFLGDLDYQYSFGLSATQDSDFAPRILSFVGTGNAKKEFYSAESVKLRVFGWDNTSQAPWGSQQNPYVISAPNQLDTLSKLMITYKYTYSGCYFLLSNDIDMSGIVFTPIGRYISASSSANYLFNGKFDGKGNTIANLTINRDYPYVALFGYTGSDFMLNNLILDASCSFTTTGSYAGSLVGYNNGIIDRCVSYASVTAANYIGGLCAYSAKNTAITNSVFFGTIAQGPTDSYGILGLIPSANINVNTANTWYIYLNESETNINPSALPYFHNSYGSVLYVDSKGQVDLTLDTATLVSADIIIFSITPDANYNGIVMTNINGVVYGGTTFRTAPNYAGGQSVNLFVRFCQNARLSFIDIEESQYMENYETSYGAGYYYYGQSASFVITLTRGYYLENLAEYTTNNYRLKNVSNNIVIDFVMGYDDENSYFEIPIAIKSASAYVAVTSEDLALSDSYDGSVKEIDVELSGVFDYYTASYYYGLNKDSVSSIKDAGVYTVYTYLYMVGNRDLFFGIVESSFSVQKKQLTADESIEALSNYWSAVVGVKTYDGTAVLNGRTINNSYVPDIVSADLSMLTIKVDITWASANAGENIDVAISNFVLSGVRANNYNFTSTTINLAGGGKINKKALIVTVAQSDLSAEFSGSIPTIKNPQVNGSLGSTVLVWSFNKLNELGEVDQDWAVLTTKTWNVGNYALGIGAADSVNYDVTFGTNTYVYTITQKLVASISYSDYEGKIYTGSVVSSNIKAIYNTVNGIAFAPLKYYSESVSEENLVTGGVINAGSYIAVPTITDANYKLSQGIANLNFSVARSSNGGAITFDVASEDLTVNTLREISFTSNVYDAELSLEVLGVTRAKMRLIEENGSYYIMATAYPKIGAVSYRIVAKDATNYEDRYSEYNQVTILPLNIYVGVKEENRTYQYGDVINIDFDYSLDYDQLQLVANAQSLDGYLPIEYQIATDNYLAGETYQVNIVGGDFDAYVINRASTCFITIEKREVKIVVTSDITANSKIYGAEDNTISYYVLEDGRQIEPDSEGIRRLPNGNALTLSGRLSRASGENVGKYTISQGTLTNANNANYLIEVDIKGDYEIKQRPIRLYIPAISKYYLQTTPEIIPAVAENYSFVRNDSITAIMNNISINIVNLSDAVGNYSYSVTYNSQGINYRIESVLAPYAFRINKGVPSVTHTIIGKLYYGEALSSLRINGQGYYNGVPLQGTFSWKNSSQRAEQIGVLSTNIVFTPQDTNSYERIENIQANINVEKRPIDAVFYGEMEYTYNGSEQCNISVDFTNLYNFDTVTPATSIDRTPINAGTYLFTVEINSDKYIINGVNSISFVIYPKAINVSLGDVTITIGETPVFEITYDGFIEGEDEGDLTKKASVINVPTECGSYQIAAQGAEAANYNFAYKKANFVINQKSIADEKIMVSGVIKAGVTVEAESVKSTDLTFKMKSELINKNLGVNYLKPQKNAMQQYVSIDFSERVYGEYEYTVILDAPVTTGSVLYTINYEGKVEEVSDFSLSEDGKSVTFKAALITGVAVYSEKALLERVKDYLPLAGAGAGFVLILVFTALGIRTSRKRNKARQAYLRSLDN